MDQIDVTRVMADIRTRASADLRSRTYDGGKTPEFSDAELFAIVEQILRNAVDDAARRMAPEHRDQLVRGFVEYAQEQLPGWEVIDEPSRPRAFQGSGGRRGKAPGGAWSSYSAWSRSARPPTQRMHPAAGSNRRTSAATMRRCRAEST